MPGWMSALGALIEAVGVALGIIERRQIESAGRAKQIAESAAETQEREDDANAATRRARDALRRGGDDAAGLREPHFRD